MSKKVKSSKAKDTGLSEPIPELICVQKPQGGANDGCYVVRIPFKYMLIKETAAWFEFKFIGLRGEWR